VYLFIIIILLISVMAKLNFQQSLLQVLVSRDPSEIIFICWFGAQETYPKDILKGRFIIYKWFGYTLFQ